MSEHDDIERPADVDAAGGFRWWMVIPVLGALAVLAVFMLGLEREDGGRNLPSTLIGKPAPAFDLPPLRAGQPGFSTADLDKPGVKLVNFWASWCISCRAEVKELEQLAAMGLPIYSINYKDTPEAAEGFLAEFGDPYTLIGADRSGRTGIDWGVYGMPETFVVDGGGRIVYRHPGPIQGSDVEKKVLPAVEAARAGS